ncbi:lauroyl acyltransferase [Defluviimonas sp. 20V17]|uniref:KDO2-lipid IV(A) lauroyltransferase n=1 Tax=Allgaiera indica TaxID=765699 RepID=A0AAN4USC7_9RHOB|nr:lauroyl acyltransferase [Allgaiera indica]KDB02093.1 lauroyl acyltransferase [Defluviimonas sp. 20V17]GHE03189.1 lauroyl acyltransferase [Allgaiera indica]SDX09897.1 KDO2-lipid IV(A) lauroyltransferase [Allgaiera indica]
MTTSEGRGLSPWLQDRLFRGVLGALLLLPYSWRVPLCGWLMSRLVAPLAGYRRRVRENLAKVLPDLPEAEVRRLERAVPDNVGRTLIEIYSGAEFVARCTASAPTGPGLAALDAAHAAGRPVILVTGHFGNYDASRAALIARGYNIGALYRPMSNPFFNDHYVRAISRIGTPLFARGRRGMAEMVKFLRGGGMLGLLMDQWMQTGARLQFFGQDALTALSAADLALKYDALVVPTYGVRRADGLTFDIVVEAPIEHGDPAVMTQAMNDSLERLTRAHPEQWFWIHRRWKDIPEWWQDPLA